MRMQGWDTEHSARGLRVGGKPWFCSGRTEARGQDTSGGAFEEVSYESEKQLAL